MSGGHFDYAQHKIDDIVSSINELILTNDIRGLDEYGDEIGRHYPPDIIMKFSEAVQALETASKMAKRIDWLVSGDDGPDSFREKWEKINAKTTI